MIGQNQHNERDKITGFFDDHEKVMYHVELKKAEYDLDNGAINMDLKNVILSEPAYT